ncbi:MAG: pyrroline-5-carboxylate reductase [Candidatus Helarchaeota archaeon]
MDLKTRKIGIIGIGNMGESILKGLTETSELNSENIYVSDIDEKKLSKIHDNYQVQTVSNNTLLQEVNIVIIAVKPQNIAEVFHTIADQPKKYDVIISIAAGIETSFIEKSIGKEVPVIRVMPNICATVKAAVSALSKGRYATDTSFQLAKTIFESIGPVVDVKEELMDVVTGLSGSGPAYIFLAIEALSDAGVLLGLSRDVSNLLAAQTTLGAAKMVLETNAPPADLKNRVTSPGGTTIQGLRILEKLGFKFALMEAVKTATERSKELRRPE